MHCKVLQFFILPYLVICFKTDFKSASKVTGKDGNSTIIPDSGMNTSSSSNTDGKIYIRREYRSHALEFKISQVDSKFLKKVFQLKEKPDFLISEENGHVFKIGERSGLKQNEFYTINSADIMEHRMNDQQKMNNRDLSFNAGSGMETNRNNGPSGNSNSKASDEPKRRYNIPVLSGSAYVGQLYDAKTDQILHDLFLWNNPIPVNEARITSVRSETSIENNLKDRFRKMDISAEIRMSLMGGMLNVKGSAAYLKEEIKTDEHVRVTFDYHRKGRQVSAISAEANQNSDACRSNIGATHVITEIQYGFNAYLLFDKKVSISESKEDISGKLEVSVKAMGIEIGGGVASVDTSESDKNVTFGMTFIFHGDTTIDPPPQTFEDAIEVYKSLPGKSLEDERVVTFSIAPLSEYCGAIDEILNSISDQNIEFVTNMLVDFEAVDKVLRRLKTTKLASDFQTYRSILLDLERRFEIKRSKFIYRIQVLLPKIRSNQVDEAELSLLIGDYNNSPFEREKFLTVLNARQKEIETAEFIIYHKDLAAISNKYVDLDNSGDMAECVIGNDYSVVYELQILPKNAKTLGQQYEDGQLNEGDKWFMDEARVGKNRRLLKDFLEMATKNSDTGSASICFLISLTQLSSEEGGNFKLKLLSSGETLVDDFSAPKKIWKLDTLDSSENHIELNAYHDSANAFANTSLTYHLYQLKATYEKIDNKGHVLKGPYEMVFEDTNNGQFQPTETESNLTISSNLEPGSFYKITFSTELFQKSNLITEGDNSEDFFINTLPSSPPSDLECTTTFDSLELTWTYPSSGMFDDFNDASFYHFYYELNEVGTSQLTKGKTVSRKYSHTDASANERLKQFNEKITPATTYEFKVNLVAPTIEMEVPNQPAETVKMESKAAFKNCYSNPAPLSGLHVVEFDHNSAKVQWEQFTHSDSTQLIKYELKFDNTLYNSATAEYVFSGLDSATEYTIEVRVVTKDYSHSVWSDPINFKTTPAKILGFKVENKVDAATVTWNKFANTHSDPAQFKKYIIELTQDGVKVADDESIDPTSLFEISSLESSTEYEAKIKVILRDFGQSEFSDPITIKTLPAQLSGLEIIDATYNTATIEWDPYLHQEELEEYKIVVKENCSACGSSARNLESNNNSKAVTALKAVTEYEVSVFVKTKSFGESVPSTINIFTKPFAPQGIRFDGSTYDSATISWDKYDNNLDNSQFQRYKIKLNSTLDDPRELTSTEETKVIDSLKPTTEYKALVSIETNLFGNSEFSEFTGRIYTKPGVLSNLAVLGNQTTHESATISWVTTLTDPGEFKRYVIEYKKKLVSRDVESPSEQSCYENQPCCEILGLEPAITYEIRVKVDTVNFGESELAGPVIVKTDSLSESDLSAVEQLESAMTSNFLEVNNVLDKCVTNNLETIDPKCKSVTSLQTEINNNLDKVNDVNDALDNNIASNMVEFNSITADISNMETDFSNMETDISNVKTTLNNNLDKVNDVNDALDNNIASNLVEFNSITADISNMETDFSNMETDFSNMETDISNVKTTLTSNLNQVNDVLNKCVKNSNLNYIDNTCQSVKSLKAKIDNNLAAITSNGVLTEDGPYGSEGGSPWTDFNTFKENGPLTALEIKSGGAINALRARYGNTWGDWHGGNGGGNNGPFEIVLVGANGIINSGNGVVDGIVFWGIDGKKYGSYGGNSGFLPWETTLRWSYGLGCRVQYISGRAGDLLDAISFYHNCKITARCADGSPDPGCCSHLRQCGIGEGDCDADADCAGNLKCGTDNCDNGFPSDYDCCRK